MLEVLNLKYVEQLSDKVLTDSIRIQIKINQWSYYRMAKLKSAESP